MISNYRKKRKKKLRLERQRKRMNSLRENRMIEEKIEERERKIKELLDESTD